MIPFRLFLFNKRPLLNKVSILVQLPIIINLNLRLSTSSIPLSFSHSQFSPDVDRLKARQSCQAQGKRSGPLGLHPTTPILQVEVGSARLESCRYYLFHPHYPFIILSTPYINLINLHHLSMYTKIKVLS